MKKFIAIGEDNKDQDVWLLIDAETKEEADELAFQAENIAVIYASAELVPYEKKGISHRFIDSD